MSKLPEGFEGAKKECRVSLRTGFDQWIEDYSLFMYQAGIVQGERQQAEKYEKLRRQHDALTVAFRHAAGESND